MITIKDQRDKRKSGTPFGYIDITTIFEVDGQLYMKTDGSSDVPNAVGLTSGLPLTLRVTSIVQRLNATILIEDR